MVYIRDGMQVLEEPARRKSHGKSVASHNMQPPESSLPSIFGHEVHMTEPVAIGDHHSFDRRASLFKPGLDQTRKQISSGSA